MHSARLLLVSLMLPLMAQTAERPEAPTTPPRTPVDLRPEFERRGLARRQQGERPTCSVFTVTTAIEFALARRDGQCPRLSVEFLNWAGNDAAGGAADGGFFSDLWRGFERHGICAEDALPYRAAFEATPSPGASALADAKARRRPGLRLHWIKEWDVNTGLTDAHLAGIERSLADGWPCAAASAGPEMRNGPLTCCRCARPMPCTTDTASCSWAVARTRPSPAVASSSSVTPPGTDATARCRTTTRGPT